MDEECEIKRMTHTLWTTSIFLQHITQPAIFVTLHTFPRLKGEETRTRGKNIVSSGAENPLVDACTLTSNHHTISIAIIMMILIIKMSLHLSRLSTFLYFPFTYILLAVESLGIGEVREARRWYNGDTIKEEGGEEEG